ncbi:hypothetical protein L6R53_25005 [Myxococcota bacterium]|nr:hypothetical protein [Myxococcota bacterium]
MLLPLTIATACGATGPAPCPGWGAPVAAGVVGEPALDEASGLAWGRTDRDLLWTHDDKGGDPVLFALGADGRSRGTWAVTGATATDWEDLAAGVGPRGPTLFIGDIGDNDDARAEVRVWRLPEPAAPDGGGRTAPAEELVLRFSDGPTDAEGLAYDPADGALIVVTKEKGRARLFRADAWAAAGAAQVLSPVATVDLSGPAFEGGRKVTAADLSPDGGRLLLRTSTRILAWTRAPGQPLAQALAATPCLLPAPDEPDGEALAAGERGWATLSEGVRPTLWRGEAP